MNANEREKQEAIGYLKESVKEGDEIYCILRHVSASGMSRVIQLIQPVCKEGKPDLYSLGWNAAKALGYNYNRDKEGIRIGGCGMDMGFALVYELSQTLFGNGYKLRHRWI